ncbi:hypothetical protein CCMSSC00406_0008048 [Pleurotus cornucopiae]|uniref:Uncharacterized protein n=1 Tax=Pleurotus cornucopiae TaxID=5321 RepID=A0ACB7IWU3_PLECO|nr:hypothetical protein CCMSSC00406_0008048 [Pleurotus cornucopiae]
MGAEGSTRKADAQTDEKTLVQSPRSVESVSSFWTSREWRGKDVDVESQPCRVHTQNESRVDAALDSSLAKSFSMVLLISTFFAGILVAFLSLMVDIGGDGFQSSFRSGQIYDTGGTLLGLLALALDLSLAAFSGVNAAISSSRAWAGLVEVGMRVIGGGFSGVKELGWAQGMEAEVERAVTKGLHIANAHPSLRLYAPHLTIMSATLAAWQHNTKFARNQVKKLLSTVSEPTGEAWPPHVVYGVHLTYIDFLIHNKTTDANSSKQDTHAALGSIQALAELASTNSQSPRPSEPLSTSSNVNLDAGRKTGEDNLDGHMRVVLLTHVLRLRVLIAAGMWSEVGDALKEAEQILKIPAEPASIPKEMDADTTPKASKRNSSSNAAAAGVVDSEDPFIIALVVHTLIIGVLYHTYSGDAQASQTRLAILHATMDKAMLEKDQETEDGVISISFNSQYSKLYIRTTHPRVIYALGFLVSSTVKRDPIGRKPKRKVFAVEGLTRWEREMKSGEFTRHLQHDLIQVESRMIKIKADLLSEYIGVSILRGEFDAAEYVCIDFLSTKLVINLVRKNLDILIAHTRNHNLFPLYAARITLHHAHLAHSLGQAERAERCYQVAYHLAGGNSSSSMRDNKHPSDSAKAKKHEPAVDASCVLSADSDFVCVAALAGRVALLLGMSVAEMWLDEDLDDDIDSGPGSPTKGRSTKGKEKEGSDNDCPKWRIELERLGKQVVSESRGMGGTLEAIGQIIEACLSKEIIKAKQHLKIALSKATRAQDNHLRALILALISAHYFHVSADHARTILVTCDQLAAGLGATSTKSKTVAEGDGRRDQADGSKGDASDVGNAPLRLWVGEKFVELHKRMGHEELANKQAQLNTRLKKAVVQMVARGT